MTAGTAGCNIAAAISLTCCIAGLWIAGHHPLAPLLAVSAFVAWVAATVRWPGAWLLLLPGLLPVLGLAPWSGWTGVDEFDLAVLATAGGGYAARARRAAPVPARGAAVAYDRRLALVLGISGVLALAIGLSHAEGLRFGWFDGYEMPLNTLRAAKGGFWALLVLPLIPADSSRRRSVSGSVLAGGIMAGVVLVALATVWERLAFTGLWKTETYYRTTALFWEMHVGGAAIETFLAIGVPFVVARALSARTAAGQIGGTLVVALAAYACAFTLSRGLYLALAVAVLPAAVMAATGARKGAREPVGGLALKLALAVALVAVGARLAQWQMRANGYEGAYIGAAAVWIVVARALGRQPATHMRRGRRMVQLALGLVLVIELGALRDGSSFLTRRLNRAADDVTWRSMQWDVTLGQLRTPFDWLFGRGSGRYTVDYVHRSPGRDLPGAFQVVETGGNAFARVMRAPSMRAVAGSFGMSQRVGPLHGGRYAVTFDARSPAGLPIILSLCEKHLIYESHCAFALVNPPRGGWQRFATRIDATSLAGGPWYAPRPVQFSVATGGAGGWVDIDNLRVVGEDGRDLLSNGDFSAAAARWFLTGRYFFLPWHADSLPLELLIERGALGLLVFAVLLARALAAWSGPAGRRDALAPAHVAALIACLTLGMFSSVLDVPRNAFLLTLLCLLRPAGRDAVEGGPVAPPIAA